MFIASVNTGHYDWTALAETEKDVEAALLKAWARHCAQVPGVYRYLMRELIEDGEVNIHPIESGTVLRDGREI